MKKFKLIIALLVATVAANAQNADVKLLGESGDGKTLKLIWFMQSWDKNTQGFDIKRRVAGKKGSWLKLNDAPITPEIALNKNLANVGADAAEQAHLNAKLQTLLNEKKIKEVPAATYLQRLSTDPKALQGVAFAIALDYDMALLNGFAAIDKTATEGTYEYGLFLDNNSKEPAATFNWTYGTKAMLSDAALNVKSDVMAKPFNIQLKWGADASKLKDLQTAGFNVYKKVGNDWTKLNSSPVNASSASGFIFSDNTAKDRNTAATYAVALVTIFGNEGNKVEHTYDPLQHPAEHTAAELGEIKSAGENYKDGFAMQWTFPQEQEKYIKGFVIEKANMPDGFKETSQLISASARTFNETTSSPAASYVNFRVVAVYNDAVRMNGNERLFYYLPVIYAPKPSQLAGRWVKENGKTYIVLDWNDKATNDTLTDGYHLYASNRFDNKMYYENSVPLIKQSEYRYEVFNNKATQYRFCIAAVSKYKAVGAFSDTITVQAPTVSLPTPVIYPYTVDSAKVTLNWNYTDVADLKGFRVYQNGHMVATEFQLKKDATKFISPELQKGATYEFAIKAVTEGGVESDMSIQREVVVQ